MSRAAGPAPSAEPGSANQKQNDLIVEKVWKRWDKSRHKAKKALAQLRQQVGPRDTSPLHDQATTFQAAVYFVMQHMHMVDLIGAAPIETIQRASR